jgi:hypothetical protein
MRTIGAWSIAAEYERSRAGITVYLASSGARKSTVDAFNILNIKNEHFGDEGCVSEMVRLPVADDRITVVVVLEISHQPPYQI